MTNLTPTEHQEQKTFVQWLKMFLPKGVFFFAVPNERKVKVTTMNLLKSQGLVSGVPDLFICHARLGFHGLFIEMKRTKGGKVSDNQRMAQKSLRDCGYCVEVCYGANHAMEVTREYFLGDGKYFDKEQKNDSCI